VYGDIRKVEEESVVHVTIVNYFLRVKPRARGAQMLELGLAGASLVTVSHFKQQTFAGTLSCSPKQLPPCLYGVGPQLFAPQAFSLC
jgi:hypothetical protein